MPSLFHEFFDIAHLFEKLRIRYAVIGGFAMAFHDTVRATRDIDLLIDREDLITASQALEEIGYRPSGTPLTFSEGQLTLHRFIHFVGTWHSMLDLFSGEEERYRDIVRNAIVVDPGNGPVHIAQKEDLIYLKSLRASEQDQIDIKRLQGE